MTTGARNPAGVLKALAAMRMRDSALSLRTVDAVKMRDPDNVLRTLSGGSIGFSATVYPTTVNGFGSSPTDIRITTGSTAVSTMGGTPPFTYAWVMDVDWDAISPTSAVSAFRSPMVPPASSISSTAYVTVTDSLGSTCNSDTLYLSATNLHG